MTTLVIIKFGLYPMETEGGICFEILAPPKKKSPMLTKKKIAKFFENQQKKNKNKQKNGLEILWRGSYPQNLAWIHAGVSKKPQFTDVRRKTDACAMTVALLTKSNRAKNEIKKERKKDTFKSSGRA